MGECIKVIKNNINVSKVIQQLEKNKNDWENQKRIEEVESLVDRGYDDLPVGVLQLIVGGVKNKEDFVGDSDICIKTPAYKNHSEIRKIVRKYFKEQELHRCGFLSLGVGDIVGAHIDEGTYYLTRDRYHLSILGRYQYFVGNESAIIDPGTLFWFNNKLPHGTVNIGNDIRVTFVFDVPNSTNNPQHKIIDG